MNIDLLALPACALEQSWKALDHACVGVPWMISYFKMRGVRGKDSESQKLQLQRQAGVGARASL